MNKFEFLNFCYSLFYDLFCGAESFKSNIRFIPFYWVYNAKISTVFIPKEVFYIESVVTPNYTYYTESVPFSFGFCLWFFGGDRGIGGGTDADLDKDF